MARAMAGVFPPFAMAFHRWFFVGLIVIIALALFTPAFPNEASLRMAVCCF